LYSFNHLENMEKVKNIFILPTREHVAVAYKPYKS